MSEIYIKTVKKMTSILHIDVSKNEADDDLIKIRFKNENFVQIRFSKLFNVSKYLQDKYKYLEAKNLIQKEIAKINKDISEESIKYFIELIEEEKVDIPYELYNDIYTLSEYFNIRKITEELNNLSENELYHDLNFTLQVLIESERKGNKLESQMRIKIEKLLINRINECLKNEKFKELSNSTISRIIEKSQNILNEELLFEFIISSASTRFILIKFVSLDKLRDEEIKEMIEILEEQDEETRKMFLDYIPFNISFIKKMTNKYDQLLKETNETKEKLSQEEISHKETKEKLVKEEISHEKTKEKLAKEKISHKETKEKLEKEEILYKETKQKLEEEKISHGETKEKRAKEEISHKETKEKLVKEEISHKETKQKLEEEKISHGETKEKLEEERTSHQKTKEKFEDDIERLKNTINKLIEENKKIEMRLNEYEEKEKKNKEAFVKEVQCSINKKEEIDQIKRDIKETKDVNGQTNNHTHAILIAGYNKYNQLGEKSNNKDKDSYYPVISPPVNLSLNPSSLLSYSVISWHSVLITSDGSLKGIGYNNDGRISSSLEKTSIDHFIDFCMKDGSGRQLDPVSAVCCAYGTLYMFSKKSGNGRQLVLCDKDINEGDPVFLDTGNHHPVALFGGYYHSASIGSEGEIIFINRYTVKNSPKTRIASAHLPYDEKASSVACCEYSVFVLSSNGRVFWSPVSDDSVLRFSEVLELSDKEIVCVSGTLNHVLAVSKEGRVFGRGSNEDGQLGLGKGNSKVSSFAEISSLVGYEIRTAYAGGHHSLFETREGKILSCGYNGFGELLLSSGPGEPVYSPTETTIMNGATFCIAGASKSVVFIGDIDPRNTPNTRIQDSK